MICSFKKLSIVAAALVVATGVALVPVAARAMTVLQVDLKTLVAAADVVLSGTIAGTRVVDRRKEGRGVWTEFTLQVAEVWKGDAKLAGKAFQWRHVGGTTTDGITVAVPGMPGFAVGEEVVVVLEKNSQGHVVSGGPQGKFTVRKDAAGRKTVTREVTDVHMLRRDPATGRIAEAPKSVQIIKTYADMRAEVLGYVKDAARAAPPPPVLPPQTPRLGK